MKKATYMSKNELLDFLKIGVLSSEVEDIANRTEDKQWKRKFKCAATYMDNIIDERLAALDPNQLRSVQRRYHHTKFKLYTSDQIRTLEPDNQLEERITVNTEDLYDLVDMALLSCYKCAQGECVEKCNIRRILHTIGCLPVIDNPGPGKCEFTTNEIGEVKSINPQYRKILTEDEKI